MPIDKKKYHSQWDKISKSVREAAGWKCELCHARHNEPHWLTGSNVILTVHHIDYDDSNNHKSNLIALCQRCHLRLDQPKHRKTRLKNKENENQMKLKVKGL